MLRIDSVNKTLGQHSWEFDTTLDTHSVTALLGRSGSGKSTLLNLIAGFMQPQSGDIQWNGQSLLQLDVAARPVTSLFQQHNLFNHLNVRQNIGLGLDPGLKLDSEQIQAVQSVIEDVGLYGKETERPRSLSGGEQQRVALARCLLRRRPILLLDEPFSALDTQTRTEMIELLNQLIASYRPCVLMVTHDPNDARALAADILHLSQGRLVSKSPPDI